MTSSPGPTSSARRARSSPIEHELVPTTCGGVASVAAAHQVAPELLLERRDLRPQREKQRVEHPPPGRRLVLAELVPVELDLAGRHGVTARPAAADAAVEQLALDRQLAVRALGLAQEHVLPQRVPAALVGIDRAVAQRAEHLADAVVDALLGAEAEHALDLVERHVVVAQIGIGRARARPRSRGRRRARGRRGSGSARCSRPSRR